MNILEKRGIDKVKNILLGRYKGVDYFCIGTPENPMGEKLPSNVNGARREMFEDECRELGIRYIHVDGVYGQKEHSYILINASVKVAEELFGYDGYNQESFIYGENSNNGVDYYYYQKNESDSPYKLLDKERNITEIKDADNFFSSKVSWKFKIDFSIFRPDINNESVKFNKWKRIN